MMMMMTLRAYTQFRTEDWDLYLPQVEFTINNSVSEATGYTPLFLNYGYHPEGFIDLLVNRGTSKVHTLEN